MSQEVKRADVWSLLDGRDVLVVSLSGLDEAYGAVLGLVLHPAGRYPGTVMSVVITDPIPCTAVAVRPGPAWRCAVAGQDVQELPLPVPVGGQLGPWKPTPDLLSQVLQQLPDLRP
ncbi:hypothetical protein ACFC96_41220 [Streptomyces sp. NPDC055955]|uniref:hypothetical protein n=1 Tax=Streptomyces sp. NPDC055955 TaxID=3345665 RepID=UPI0035D877C9